MRGAERRHIAPRSQATSGDAAVPEVSVVIPTYRRADHIERAVRCALGQRDVDLEVLVVVDGARDDTAERVAAIADPRVRSLVLDHNQGVATARNRGAAAARGPWLSFLDDDDYWAPERTRALLDAGGSAALVTAGTIDVEPTGRVLQFSTPPPAANIRWSLFTSNAIGGPSSAIVRRSVFEAVGGFDPSFEVLADWDLWLRVLRDHEAAVASGMLHGYVVHPAAMHVQRTDAALTEYRRLQERHRREGRTGDPDFMDGIYLRWIADTHKRAGRRQQAFALSRTLFAADRSGTDLRRMATLTLPPRVAAWLRARRDRPQPLPPWLAGLRSPAAADET
ncbi:MAG: hypothetical protein QOE86_1668 [Solirubrobacteraceae bacterium]|nr:hypothetical protein [Solirubrobacteraceae bacterium]